MISLEQIFSDSDTHLVKGDCLRVMERLPTASVDALITDPPYCSGGYRESDRQGAAGQGVRSGRLQSGAVQWFAGDNMTTGGIVFLLRNVMCEAARVLRDDRSAFVFTDWRMMPALAPALESAGFRYRNLIVWDKGNAGLGSGFRPAHELVMEFSKGSTDYQARDGANVIKAQRVHHSRKRHPTEKPVELLAELARVAVPAGGVVLDPFTGSGATLEAAVEAGCRAVGIERADRHCQSTADRLAQDHIATAPRTDTP
jgi:site-specific DNA-methyltransferase (adenine-specific)